MTIKQCFIYHQDPDFSRDVVVFADNREEADAFYSDFIDTMSMSKDKNFYWPLEFFTDNTQEVTVLPVEKGVFIP